MTTDVRNGKLVRQCSYCGAEITAYNSVTMGLSGICADCSEEIRADLREAKAVFYGRGPMTVAEAAVPSWACKQK